MCLLGNFNKNSLFIWTSGCVKNHSVQFNSSKYQANTAFCENFLFGFLIPYSLTKFHFWVRCRSDAEFAEFLLAFVDLWDDKFSFSAFFCFESGSLAWTSAVISTGYSLLHLSKFCSLVSGLWLEQVSKVVFQRLETFASLSSSTVAPLFFFFVFGGQLALSFFSSKVFEPSTTSFRVPSPRNIVFHILSEGLNRFFRNTTTSLWSSFFKIRPDLCGKRTLFELFRGLVSISVSCFYSELGNANVVQKLKEHRSIQCVMWYVCQNFFQPVSFGKMRLFLVLSKQTPHYPPLTMFHIFDAHFLQKHLLDPMAFCLAGLVRSYLKVARMFGGQTFSPASF